MRAPLRLWRLARLALHLVHGLGIALFALPGDPARYRAHHWRRVGRWMARLLDILGVHGRWHGAPAAPPVLYTANHVSWLDIPVLQARLPAGFIAKAEVARWPLIGFLARRGASLFIARGRHDSTQEVLRAMVMRLRAGQALVVFPEGTTGDGRGLRPFRARLLQAAREAGVPLQTLALRYRCADCPPERLAFVGEDTFLANFWRLLGLRRIEVDVFCAPPIAAGDEARALAADLHARTAALLGLSDSAPAEGAGEDGERQGDQDDGRPGRQVGVERPGEPAEHGGEGEGAGQDRHRLG